MKKKGMTFDGKEIALTQKHSSDTQDVANLEVVL